MLSYALRRLAMIVPVLLGISIIVFLIMAMIPGDPALAILGSFATPENTAQLRQDLGLDRPLIVQYAVWLGNLLQGDLGTFSARQTPVIDEVARAFPITIQLTFLGISVAVVAALVLGVIAALSTILL